MYFITEVRLVSNDGEVKKNAIVKEAVHMAWPEVCESFLVALAGMVDSFFGGETLYQLFFREEEIIATGVGDTTYTAMASTISVT